MLALKSKAPLQAVAMYGHENFWENFKRLRRTDMHFVVGKPFHIETHGEAMSKDVRQAITDELMYKIAELLPEKYHGCYPVTGKVEYRYLVED